MSAVMNAKITGAIGKLSGLPMWGGRIPPPPGRCTIEVLYTGGDLTLTYDPKEAAETAAMQAGFDALTALGYAAMVVAPPERAGQTTVLDKEAEAIVFVPQICGG